MRKLAPISLQPKVKELQNDFGNGRKNEAMLGMKKQAPV